jgi:LruC domain-containing protein
MFKKYILIFLIFLLAQCGKDKNPFMLFPGNNNDGNQTSSSTTTSDNTNNNTSSTSNNNTNTINDQCGTLNYDTQTVVDVNVRVQVLDIDGPVVGATVVLRLPNNAVSNLFQVGTNENGIAQGIAQISTSVDSLLLEVKVGSNVIYFANINNRCDLGQYLVRINRNVVVNDDVNNQNPIDSDGDGTPDVNDAYPDDPTRATKIVFPLSGAGVIAFEDLYPVPGDADFNDVVLQIYNEEDLNTQGQVVRIRGRYRFLARGAGYNHVVLIKLSGSGKLIQKVYDGNNNRVSQINTHVDSLDKVPLFLKDSLFFANPVYTSSSIYRTQTLCSHNAMSGSSYVPCYSSEIEIIFDQPQPKTKQTSAPYDLYIYVLNTNKEIHFPGLYLRNDGSDVYLDNDGFPWALLIPTKWNWPLERKYITTGYPCFDEWYVSRGTNFTDWYLRVDSTSQRNLYPYFSDINYSETTGCR